MANYIPIEDGETPVHEAINSRVQSLSNKTLGGSRSGMVALWPGAVPPADWLLCDGTAVSRETYAALFAVIGTTFGVGDGSTTFNLPDGRGRAMGGVGLGSGLSARTMGQSVGEETHTLSVDELPAHTHQADTQLAVDTGTDVSYSDWSGTQTSGSTGGDGAHNNMQPSLVLNWVIRS